MISKCELTNVTDDDVLRRINVERERGCEDSETIKLEYLGRMMQHPKRCGI